MGSPTTINPLLEEATTSTYICPVCGFKKDVPESYYMLQRMWFPDNFIDTMCDMCDEEYMDREQRPAYAPGERDSNMSTDIEKEAAVEPMVVTCSFCRKPKADVGLIVVATKGSKIAICDGCIVLCCEIMSHEYRELRKREEDRLAATEKQHGH